MNKPEKWGDQIVVDAQENVIEEVPFWLSTSTDLPLTNLGEFCLSAGGLFIPAHIDRPSQSVLSQLGYLPNLPYTALEVRTDAGGLEDPGQNPGEGKRRPLPRRRRHPHLPVGARGRRF